MNTVYEPARQTPVSAAADVVVAGGGIAGVAAALSARRAGASVILLEKEAGLGGLATLGNVIIFLPLCDGRGQQVIGGLGEELLRLSVARLSRPVESLRLSHVPSCWEPGGKVEERCKQRFRVGFNPVDYQLDLEELVLGEGIRLLYDTRCCGVVQAAGEVSAVLVESKSGRTAVRGRAFVDATGDADLCAFAGESTAAIGTNVPCGWYYTYDADESMAALRCMTRPFAANGGPATDGGVTFRGDAVGEVTELIVESHRMMRRELAARRSETGHEILPIHIPSIACFRMTRRLKGRVELSEADDHRYFADALGMTGDWRKAGPIYTIPLGMLAAVRNRNLFAAGRCVSAVGRVWDLVRAIPTCVVTGEAAGLAAAMSVECAAAAGSPEQQRWLAMLQDRLRRAGVILDPELLEQG